MEASGTTYGRRNLLSGGGKGWALPAPLGADTMWAVMSRWQAVRLMFHSRKTAFASLGSEQN